jgi:hypothetical protein
MPGASLAERAARVAAALDGIDRRDLTELKRLINPPAGVSDAVFAVLVLNGVHTPTWSAAQQRLRDVGTFIESDLRGLQRHVDAGTLPAKNVALARPLLELEHVRQVAAAQQSPLASTRAAAALAGLALNLIDWFDARSQPAGAEASFARERARAAVERTLDNLSKINFAAAAIKVEAPAPAPMQLVMEAVCITLGETPDWPTAVRMLGGAGAGGGRREMVQLLRQRSQEDVQPHRLKALRPYIQNAQFQPEKMRSGISGACV